MPETLTLAHVVRADLIALDEHRLQAQIDSEYKPPPDAGPRWKPIPKNVVGDPKLRQGCAMGVAFSDEFRAMIAETAEATSSICGFLDHSAIEIADDEEPVLMLLQILHDSWLDSTVIGRDETGSIADGRLASALQDDEKVWLTTTFEDNPHRPTEQDFRDFLHVIAKSRGIELPPPAIAG